MLRTTDTTGRPLLIEPGRIVPATTDHPHALFPDVAEATIDAAVLCILADAGAAGSRNVDVWRELGLNAVTDKKQWISYRSLERLQKAGRVVKRAHEIEGRKRPEQRYHLALSSASRTYNR